jgi:hypothetical protein
MCLIRRISLDVVANINILLVPEVEVSVIWQATCSNSSGASSAVQEVEELGHKDNPKAKEVPELDIRSSLTSLQIPGRKHSTQSSTRSSRRWKNLIDNVHPTRRT